MQPSRKGLIFIAAREALVLSAYQDGEHKSIGFGHNDPNLKLGDTITVKRAFELLREDIAPRAAIIAKKVRVKLQQHEFDAVFSCFYQSGTDALTDLAAAIHSGDRKAIAVAYLKHTTNAAGDHMDGLLKRRARELCLHLTGEYGDLTRIPFWKGHPKKTPMETYELQDGDL